MCLWDPFSTCCCESGVDDRNDLGVLCVVERPVSPLGLCWGMCIHRRLCRRVLNQLLLMNLLVYPVVLPVCIYPITVVSSTSLSNGVFLQYCTCAIPQATTTTIFVVRSSLCTFASERNELLWRQI